MTSLTIYQDHFARGVSRGTNSVGVIQLYLTLPHPPRPLKSVGMPNGELSPKSSRGIVFELDEVWSIFLAATAREIIPEGAEDISTQNILWEM